MKWTIQGFRSTVPGERNYCAPPRLKATRHTELAGHHNQKQKINYMEKVRSEDYNLKDRVAGLEVELKRYETSYLFPWVNIPTGISEIEREDCYYSAMFDPILDETTDFSCKRREYVAGIARLTDTRHENQLINAIRIENQAYVVRFCDLAPRNIADIYGDTKKATTRKHTVAPKSTTKVGKKATKSSYVPPSTTPMPQISSTPTTPSYTMPSTSFFTLSTRTTTSIPLTSRTAPNPNLPRQVPIEIRLDGEDTFETINSQLFVTGT
ncbi:hypothetical protein TELCIR_01751 [Teladorsagia circumcincta]|uniref:Uncharacterized protein n=1 Tax=Teladorsagia circumcincta TaxID=45464 RepID=A0A2G9V128_TELCI|nr:hypothetical protein TELCIR_01751 [Teladorsagia circumcincta]